MHIRKYRRAKGTWYTRKSSVIIKSASLCVTNGEAILRNYDKLEGHFVAKAHSGFVNVMIKSIALLN